MIGKKVVIVDLAAGSPLYTAAFTKGLTSLTNKVSLFCTSPDEHPHIYSETGLKPKLVFDLVCKFKWKNRKTRRIFEQMQYLMNLPFFFFYVLFTRPSVVHFQWLPLLKYTNVELSIIKLFQRLGVSCILTVHNVLPHDTGNKYFEKHRTLYSLMHGLVCHTEESKRFITEKMNISQSKIAVINHGVFPVSCRSDEIKTREERIKKLNDGKVMFLLFGNIRPYKGVDFILGVFSEVIKENNNVILNIVGGGYKEDIYSVNALIEKLGLTNNVKTSFGWCEENDMIAHHLAADVLLYPYKEVTASGALMTGLQFKRPAMVSDVGVFKEIIDHNKNGIRLTYENKNDWIKAVIDISQDKNKRQILGEEAYKTWSHPDYKWEEIGKRTIRFYNQLDTGKN